MARYGTNAHVLAVMLRSRKITKAEAATMLGVTERTVFAWLSRPSSKMHRKLSKRMLRYASIILTAGSGASPNARRNSGGGRARR